jgi:hypothetical protein
MVKRAIPPLVLERVFDNVNLFLLSVVEYKRKHYICVIDDISQTQISAYVLDFAEREKVDVDELLSDAIKWFYSASHAFPFSLYLAKLGKREKLQNIYTHFNKAYVGRVVGQPFMFYLSKVVKQRKKKANIVPKNIEIRFRGQRTTLEATQHLASVIVEL